MKVIKINDLVKKYGDFVAVDNISLDIEEGQIYGLLGPNGAGKSTTISILCGILKSTRGEIEVLGEQINNGKFNNKKLMGLVPQNIALYDDYSAYENIKFFGSLYGLRRKTLEEKIDKALEFTGLTDVKHKRAKEFSGGMLRRLNIACAIVHEPKIIIMDEPTVGIDPQSRNHILESVRKLNEAGATIIYTSHYMEEIEAICSKIAIIDHGKVIVEGTKEELKNIVSDKRTLELEVENIETVNIREVKAIKGVTDIVTDDNKLIINSSKEVNNLDKIITYFTEKEIKIKDIGYKEINLETVFLSLTGRKLRD